MTPKYLVDTDWAVHYLRGKRHDIVARLQELAPDGLATSIISVAELYAGVYRSNRPTENRGGVENYLAIVEVPGVDADVAETFGREDARLRAAGTPLDRFDLLIAATAVRHGLLLLTNNRQHFERVAGLKIESLP